MPCCSAAGCSNRTEGGVKLYRFPANQERRQIWENKVNRLGWEPTANSYLCQVHFDQDQFENRRIDGKRKLKWNAVPTIFSQCIAPKHRKSSMKQSLPETCKKKADHPDHTYSEHQQNDNVWSDFTSADCGPECILGDGSSEDEGTRPVMDDSNEEESEDDFMPALPPHMRKTETTTTTSSAKEDQTQEESGGTASEDESEEYCPALPPHMLQGGKRKPTPPSNPNQRRAVVGPMLPKGFIPPSDETDKKESTDEEEDEDKEGPVVGPLPPSEKVDPGEYRARELEERARRMRDKLEGRDKVSDKPLKRESWMTELPEDKPNFCGLGARQFLRKTPAEKGDRSVWTDTPADRARKAAKEQEEQQQEKEEKGTIQDQVIQQRDKDLTKKVDEYNKAKRAKPLVDLHRIELKKQKKGEGPKERRPFSREEDLNVNKFDEAQKSNIMKKARQLNDRFSSGKAKFL